MKLVTAIIESTNLDPVRNWLVTRGFSGVTITENRIIPVNCKSQTGRAGESQSNGLVPTVKIEVAVADDSDVDLVSSVLTSFCTHAEAIPCVHSIDHVVRIRTGESGLSAL